MPHQTKNRKPKVTPETTPQATVSSSPFKKVSFSRNQLIMFGLVFAAIGGFIIYRSFAASVGTPYAITSSLADNSTISGKLAWTATVTPQPYEVDFYIDGVKDSHIEYYGPYQYKGDPNGVLDTTLLTNGKHTFQEVAIYDNQGNTTISPAGYLQNKATISALHNLTVSNTAAGSAPTISLSASPTSVSSGSASTLTWTSTNATSCLAGGAWTGSRATSGSISTGGLGQTGTFTLTCTGGGGSTSASVTITVGTTTSPTTCTTTLTATSSIINAYNAAHAGDTICLPASTTYTGDIDFRNSIGTASAPITITSQNHASPATIKGRIVTHPGANYLTLSWLKLDGISSSGNPSPTISSDHMSLIHNDITDENTSICVNAIDDPTYGTAHYTLIDHNRIHNCGPLPSTNRAHGIYDIGYYTTITNNYIYDNVDRGIQLRMDHNATVKYNVSDSNGEGMIIGDSNVSAVNDDISYNIFSNSNIRYNIEYYWPAGAPSNPNNNIHNNCSWTTATGTYAQNSSIQPGFTGATLTNNKFANPQYNNRSAKDFSLAAGSACTGYGVQPGATPGAN